MTLRVSKHLNQPCSVIFVNFYNFLNNVVIMSSLVSTEIVNWVTTADACVHTDDTTKLSPTIMRIRVHTADADATKQFRPVGVGGVYWELEWPAII